MRPWIPACLALILAAPLSTAHAQSSDFCNGYAEGWKTVKGALTIVPICPIAPITPIGSTPYREGIKAGIRAAQRIGGGQSGGGSTTQDDRTFCQGYAVGWKTVKGDLSIVPICPIAPITPIGSTPYREGIKAGIAKAEGS